MTAAGRLLSWTLAATAVLGVALAVSAILFARGGEAVGSGQTQGERIAMIKAERARLQARAGAEARIGLLPAFRVAALLTDALAARVDGEEERTIDQLPANRRQALNDIDALNAALRNAVAR